MDPELQAKIAEAKANGYTDEEIQQYLATKDQPLPADQPRDRSEEQLGVAQTALPEAGKLALEIGGAGLAYKGIKNLIRGPVAPAAEAAPGATQRILSQTFGRPGSIPTTAPAANPAAVYAGQGAAPAPAAAEAAPAGASMLTNMTPAMMLGAPYAMAGMEAANIRKNPNAPAYANVPYAQMYRGEAPTMGSAAASNRREAIGGQQYGGLSPDEQQILKQDRDLSYAIRLKAAKKVLGQP